MRLAFVGRLVKLKAVDLLLLAIKRLANTSMLRLEIFGDGNMRSSLEQQCQQLGLTDMVTFHGFVPQREIAEMLGDCDALVLPSLRDCGGSVVLEAMALGLPVIASNWGGPPDYLDESCGILIPVDDRDAFLTALEQAIKQLMDSPSFCAELGRNARKRVETAFDWEKKVDAMLDIYQEAIVRFRG